VQDEMLRTKVGRFDSGCAIRRKLTASENCQEGGSQCPAHENALLHDASPPDRFERDAADELQMKPARAIQMRIQDTMPGRGFESGEKEFNLKHWQGCAVGKQARTP